MFMIFLLQYYDSTFLSSLTRDVITSLGMLIVSSDGITKSTQARQAYPTRVSFITSLFRDGFSFPEFHLSHDRTSHRISVLLKNEVFSYSAGF